MRPRIALAILPIALLLASPLAAEPTALRTIDPLLRDPALVPPVDLPGLPTLQDDVPTAALMRAPGLDDAGIRALETAGLTFRRKADHRLVQVGATYVVEALPPTLRRLAAAGWGLEVARPLDNVHPPTRVTGPEIQVDYLLASGPTPVDGLTGEGITIMDIDSGVDPFHPHLFHADGGAYAWVDVDGNGQLDPGEDGIDRDGDGSIDDDEVLQLMDAWTWTWDYDDWEVVIDGQDGRVDPDADFLWIDRDEDGRRDYGADRGFDEDDPGYGEWILVPDDVDRDGYVDPEEKLLLLGTSRIKVVWDHDGNAWRRGENLVEYPVDIDEAGHGTGVLGIIAGGRPMPPSKWPGLLPDVDLLLWAYPGGDTADMVAALDAAQDEEVDVLLFEMAGWLSHFLDGSEYVERTIDDLMEDDGIIQVCPAGNLAGHGKHTSQVEQDGRLHFGIHVPEPNDWVQYWYMAIDLHVAPNSFVVENCFLTLPSGESFAVPFDGEGPEIADGIFMYSVDSQSGRGAEMYQVYLYPQADGPQLPDGEWALDCDHDDPAGRPVHAFVGDNASTWNRGIWLDDESDATTLCWPSSADNCISVGASVGRTDEWTVAGELHSYSSRGPRIDDGKTIDVVAPADAMTPAPTGASWYGAEPAEYRVFGGTSGAGPHVAALAAQLRQGEPDAEGLEIREMLREGARVDSQVDVDADALPDDDWGYGKVRGYKALFGDDPPAPPEAPVDVSIDFTSAKDGDLCRVTATADGWYADATFRWDWSYDGDWDGGFDAEPVSYLIEPGAELAVRVQAAKDGWWVGDALGLWTVPDNCRSGNACAGCGQGCTAGGDDDVERNGVMALLLVAVALIRRRRRG